MVEAGATEVSEEIMVEALMVAHKEINRLCRWQKELYKALDIQKREVIPSELDREMVRKSPSVTVSVYALLSTRQLRTNVQAMVQSMIKGSAESILKISRSAARWRRRSSIN